MLGILALILFVLLMVIGGERGAITVMALAGNIILLSLIIILTASGLPPILVTLLGSIAISYVTLLSQNGKNVKTGAAFLATVMIMTVFFMIIYVVIRSSESGGLNEIQAMQEDVLYYFNVNIHINMLHVVVCMTLLSTLGAVLDTALSITSSVYEVWMHRPDLSKKELYHSGLQIGKEIIGTTINTLLFAYLGESIFLFAYLKIGKFTVETIINSKFLFQYVAVLLFGGIACLVAVPAASACIAGCTAFMEWYEEDK